MPDIQIDDGLHVITVGDHEYRIDLIEVSTQISRIVEKHKDSKGYAHLADFATHMRQAWGMELCPGQAERLWQDVVLEVQRQKKDYMDALNSLMSSPASVSSPEE